MLGFVLEVVILVSTVNHAGDSTIYSIRIFSGVFLQIRIKVPSDS